MQKKIQKLLAEIKPQENFEPKFFKPNNTLNIEDLTPEVIKIRNVILDFFNQIIAKLETLKKNTNETESVEFLFSQNSGDNLIKNLRSVN